MTDVWRDNTKSFLANGAEHVFDFGLDVFVFGYVHHFERANGSPQEPLHHALVRAESKSLSIHGQQFVVAPVQQ